MGVERSGHVVLAVGEDHVESALTWAVEEAVRRGGRLHVVHVLGHGPQGPPLSPLEDSDVRRAGRDRVDDVVEQVRKRAGDQVEVTTELAHGAVVPALAHAAEDAGVIVVEHRALSRLRRVVTRSVAGGVAARSRTPVVAVPEGWAAAASGVATVTVGVDEPDRSVGLLREGVRAAAHRGGRVRVLHAVDIPDVHLDATITPLEFEKWVHRDTAAVHSRLEPLAKEAGVPFEVEVVRGPAADLLLRETETSELLVLGRHHSRIPIGSHLGSIPRAVIREASCPVLLLDSETAGGQAD